VKIKKRKQKNDKHRKRKRRFLHLCSEPNERRRHYVLGWSVRLSVCPFFVRPASVHPLSINTCFAWRNSSILSGRISMKLAANIHHTSGNFWKDLKGQRSEVKVMARWKCAFPPTYGRPSVTRAAEDTDRRCGVEADSFGFTVKFLLLIGKLYSLTYWLDRSGSQSTGEPVRRPHPSVSGESRSYFEGLWQWRRGACV